MRIAVLLLTALGAAWAFSPHASAAIQGSPPDPGALKSTAGRAAGPEDLAKALQLRYERIRDFSASFTQTYRGGTLRTQAREQGTVSVKKPGMMRWIYTQPEKKEIVSDGRKLYLYYPSEKQVIVSDVPADTEASTGAMFLAGKGDLGRDFTAAAAESVVAGGVAIKLTPRRSQPDYEHLVIAIDPASLQIRALTTVDRLGGENTLTFTNLKENTGVSEKEFMFRIPGGVTVATNDSAR